MLRKALSLFVIVGVAVFMAAAAGKKPPHGASQGFSAKGGVGFSDGR